MVMQKVTWLGSAVLLATQLGSSDAYAEVELDRISGYNSGSFMFINDANGFAQSGTTYDITNGSTYVTAFYRDANGFVISGHTLELGKTIHTTLFRTAGGIVISGLRVVS